MKYIEENFIETLPKDRKMDVLILGAGGFTMSKNSLNLPFKINHIGSVKAYEKKVPHHLIVNL